MSRSRCFHAALPSRDAIPASQRDPRESELANATYERTHSIDDVIIVVLFSSSCRVHLANFLPISRASSIRVSPWGISKENLLALLQRERNIFRISSFVRLFVDLIMFIASNETTFHSGIFLFSGISRDESIHFCSKPP